MAVTVKMSLSADELKRRLKTKLEEKTKAPRLMVGVNNADVATYAQYLEYGWVQRVTPKQAGFFRGVHGVNLKVGTVLTNPPRPFLRDTARAEGANWGEMFKKAFIELGSAEKAIKFLGLHAPADVKETLSKAGTSLGAFVPRSPLTLLMAKNNHNPKGTHRTDSTGTLERAEAGISSGKLERSIVSWIDEA